MERSNTGQQNYFADNLVNQIRIFSYLNIY